MSLAASLVLFFVVQSFVISREVELLSENNMISRLQHDQEQILAALAWSPETTPALDGTAIPVIYKRPFSGHYFQLEVAGRQLRSRSLWDEKLPATAASVTRDLAGPKQQQLLVLSRTVQWHGQSVRIQVAEDVSLIESSTASFQRHFLLFAAAAVLALLVLQGWLINFSLKPLQRVREKLGQLDRGEVEQVVTPTPEEITPLVAEVNRLMVLMRKRLMRSRHALGDLAHSLKTPLAVARQIVERQPQGEDRSQLETQLSLIHARIETELGRARTAGPMPGGQWKEVRRDLQDLVGMLERAFPHITIELKLDLAFDGIDSIGADREDMLEILGNLMENACKWSRSRVRCMIGRQAAAGFVISVEDDGAGIPAEQLDRLMERMMERGMRADEAQPGHGLGLAIVHEMVLAYDGDIDFSSSPHLHGLRVTIHIPGKGSAA
jgi:signal transduction histidine kinase